MGEEIPRFVKWAGGKVQLIEQFKPFFPKQINRYFEPFVGSGAVAFYIIQHYKPSEVFLSDINEELINAYNIIKTDYEKLVIELKKHKEFHLSEPKSYYYSVREIASTNLSTINKAARFIYLNKTCWNGLYRVNSKGGFNVPIGSYENPDIVQEDKLKLIYELLQNVNINKMPFEKITSLVNQGDFVYFDPPYHPLHKASFTTYTKDKFLEEEQINLFNVFRECTTKGVKCMLSNSDTKFIRDLYRDFRTETVQAKRMINSVASKRGAINEVVILNY